VTGHKTSQSCPCPKCGKRSGWVVFHDRACAGRYPVTPKDTLATFGCARHTGNDGYCVALDDLLAHADEAPGTCAEPFEIPARLRSAAFKQQGIPCFRCHLNVS
jgi:hypothetical protein